MERNLNLLKSKTCTESNLADDNKYAGQLLNKVSALVAHFHSGNHIESESIALDIIQKSPDHVLSWKILSVVFALSGRLKESLEATRTALKLSPNDEEIHNNLGNILRELGRFNEAEQSFLCAIDMNPDFAEAYNNLGNTLNDLDRLYEAEASYKKAIKLKPNYAEALTNLGGVLRQQDRLEDAEACLVKALEIQPDLSEAHRNLGDLFLTMGRFSEALDEKFKGSGLICFHTSKGWEFL